MNGDILVIAIAMAGIIGTVFLILSKTNTARSNKEELSDDYLNSIINAEDEEWDPES